MHPTTKILALICLGIMLNKLNYLALSVLLSLIFVVLTYWRVNTWAKMLFRMRWLFLSMLLVYGFTTPGEYIPRIPMTLGMTYEGVEAGFLQIFRLAVMLGGMSLLMASANRNSLISGFYVLLKPLGFLNLKPERFAARLYLTLQYLEDGSLMQQKADPEKFWSLLQDIHLDSSDANGLQDVNKAQAIELEIPSFTYVDLIAFIGMIIWVLIS